MALMHAARHPSGPAPAAARETGAGDRLSFANAPGS